MIDVRGDFERLAAVIESIAVHVERYERYAEELRRARAEQARMRRARPDLRPGLEDMEAELSYLRLRETGPSTVVQIGCPDGWSAAWLLRALRDNGHGRLHSFGVGGGAPADVPEDLAAGRWEPIAGGVRAAAERLPAETDYLFVDGTRPAGSARWYLPNVVDRLAPGTPVSVGGVFRRRRPLPFGEAARLLRWLRRGRMDFFTASPARAPMVHRQLDRVRCALGLDDPVHTGRRNATVFFHTA